ncbi:hypothetical protein MTR_7g092660 [Medicago truncatula]|uniref:Uncharacterized protein n=1 Tax=Medicago truncatula TaxID=3880 RepID=G7KUG8_MEDTR|nr:hypothetical protein MTR_7g092660 [Medicago truncatula]
MDLSLPKIGEYAEEMATNNNEDHNMWEIDVRLNIFFWLKYVFGPCKYESLGFGPSKFFFLKFISAKFFVF